MEKHIKELIDRYPALSSCLSAMEGAFDLMYSALKNGGRVYVCGNGGSASDCQHITGELMKGFEKRRPVKLPAEALAKLDPKTAQFLEGSLQGALPCHSLTAETSLITAVSNDVSADMVFAQQVYGYAKPGDCLVCITTSGNAKNVCLAAELAAAMGLSVVGLTGRSGGRLAGLCDAAIRVPADRTADVQEFHLPVYHALCRALEDGFFAE